MTGLSTGLRNGTGADPDRPPPVAVQMVTFNSAATVDMSIRALRAQIGVDFCLVVIDNASTDDTVSQLRALGIEPHINAENVGYAAAHNQALALLESRYVLTLNPDVALMPGFLAAMCAALDSHPEAGSAAGRLLRVEQLGDSPEKLDGAGLAMRRNRRQYLRLEGAPPNSASDGPIPVFGVDGAAAFYRRAMLHDVAVAGEIFDADFFMHKEDVDLSWRARLRGWECLYVPGAVAHHVRHFRAGQRARVSSAMRFYGARNRYLLMLKNEIPAHFWRGLPLILAYDAGILAYMLLRERASLRIFPSLWALRKKMLTKRRTIQAARRVSRREMAPWFR